MSQKEREEQEPKLPQDREREREDFNRKSDIPTTSTGPRDPLKSENREQ